MGMREEFEAWFMGLLGIDLLSHRHVDEKGIDGYFFDDFNDERTSIATCAWLSWQASHTALVIELPPRDYYRESDNPVDLLDYVTSELTDAGVTIVTITVPEGM